MENKVQKSNQTSLITKENWLQKWPEIPVKASSSAVEVLQLETPQLCRMSKLDGEMFGITIFRGQIADLVGYMGASWSAEQCDECGELAYDECYWFSLAELKQCIMRIKTGFYTSHKNFSPGVFMEFLQQYASEIHAERGKYYGTKKSELVTKPVPTEILYQALSVLEKITPQIKDRVIEILQQPVSDDQFSSFIEQLTNQMKERSQEEKHLEMERKTMIRKNAIEKMRALGLDENFIKQYEIL